MGKYKACVFDFDLTLADSSVGILICFRHTLKKFGYIVPDDSIIYNTIGLPLVDAFDLLTGIPNNPQRMDMQAEYILKANDEMVKNTFFYDGAVDGLVSLRKNGVKIGVVSSKLRFRIVESFEKKAGCMPVDELIGLDDAPKPKPDPGGLMLCMERLGVKKNETLYIGDNIIDAKTAMAAGVDFAAVLTGSTSKDEFRTLDNVFIADKLTDIFDFIYK